MRDLSNISYDEAVTKLATWYRQKQASIGEGVGRLGEWIGNNPGTAATIGGGALGGLIGGATEGPDGWRGRVRRSLTGAVAGAGIGGGGALAAKSLLGGHPAAAGSAGPTFTTNGRKMQFDPKAVAADPNLSGELASLNEPTANQTVLGGLRKGWGAAMTAAPITTSIGLPATAMREIYHHGTMVSPGAGKGPVADLQGSTHGWADRSATKLNELVSSANKQMKETADLTGKGVQPLPYASVSNRAVRDGVVNDMISDAAGRKVNPVGANQHFDLFSKLKGIVKTKVPGVGTTPGGLKGIAARAPDMKLKPAGSFRGRAFAPLALSGVADLLRHAYLGSADDSEKKQKLLDLVRQHAKPVQG